MENNAVVVVVTGLGNELKVSFNEDLAGHANYGVIFILVYTAP
jgi:hypothetical protein